MLSASLNPMMRQYLELKSRCQDCFLFFRLGDFYEMFFDDAEKGARLLGLTLTVRDSGGQKKAPMCGVPFHSAQQYIAKLLKLGEKVAICEQMDDPKKGKKLVRRDIVRILTPGTVVESGFLKEKENNYLVAFARVGDEVGLALLDLSTGEFRGTSRRGALAGVDLRDQVSRLGAAESLIPPELIAEEGFTKLKHTPAADSLSPARARQDLLAHFETASLEAFGCEDRPAVQVAAARLLSYAKRASGARLEHLSTLSTFELGSFLRLDPFTLSALEIVTPAHGQGTETTLMSTLDSTRSAAGSRTLRSWLVEPLAEAGEILNRHDAVEWLLERGAERRSVRELLGNVSDMERIGGRVGSRTANARDLIALRSGLGIVLEIRGTLEKAEAEGLLKEALSSLDDLPELRALLHACLADDPPQQINEGGIIRDGYDTRIDELRELASGSKGKLLEVQERERRRTRIDSLKVHYNSVFGYFIEISKAKAHMAPDDYERKQTLTGAERFVTPELKELEARILGAEERLRELEHAMFVELRERVATDLRRLLRAGRALGALDALAALAETAERHGYVRPAMDPSGVTEIVEGRHPVLERLQETFVGNDLHLVPWQDHVLVITGPNMAGKSTFLRQAALITLMAHAGSFVPAKAARIGVADGIYCRIGASDRLAKGQSTFMVEMTEAAHILNHATERSLLIFDEIGRGTSTYDGISIASAIVEHILKEIGAKTLFATHYYELTSLAETYTAVKNLNVLVREWKGNLVFLYKIVPGRADRSYGVQVAKLAGLPGEVVSRARDTLAEFERNVAKHSDPRGQDQLSLFNRLPDPIRRKLEEAEPETMTPLEALGLLHALREMLRTGTASEGDFSDA